MCPPAFNPRGFAAAISLVLLSAASGSAAAEAPSVNAKHFPPGHFLKYQRVPVREKQAILDKIGATLDRLNREGQRLIAKGAVIEAPRTDLRSYPQLTVLDDSGLLIIVKNVPNLYYNYRGDHPINPNTYLVIKNVRLNVPESYIRESFVVEGEFVAYAQKFVGALLEEAGAGAGDKGEIYPAGPPKP